MTSIIQSRLSRRGVLALAAVSALALNHANGVAAQSDEATQLLQESAEAMRALQSLRWKLEYLEGNTTIFSTISLNKGEGAFARPGRLIAEGEAEVGFLDVDVHVLSNGKKVWVETLRIDRVIVPDESLEQILTDPLEVVAQVLLAIEDAVVTGVETVDGVEQTTITGLFNSDLITSEYINDFLQLDEPMPVEIVLNEQRQVISATQTGPLVGYDSDDVSRIVTFWDFDVPIEIELPE